jgi:phage terminase small subunit
MSSELASRRRRFVAEYLVDLNQTAAALRAGYSEKSARFMASRLMQVPEVRDAIQEAMRKVEERTEVTQDYVVRSFHQLAQTCMAPETFDAANANRALENLGKHLGMFTKRVSLSVQQYDLKHASEEQLARIAAGEDPADVLGAPGEG